MSGVFVFRQPPQGFHTEYFGGGGGKGGTTVQATQIPPEVLARYNAVNARAESVAEQPFKRYGGEFVAPVNQQQQMGINNINALSGPVTQEQIAYYQNPFTQAVVDPTVKALQQQQGQQRSQQQAQMAKAGAFGNSRTGLERATLAGQQGLATAQAISPLYAHGYQNAQGMASGEMARRMQVAQAQIAGGTLQQQTAQAGNAAAYQQHLQEQGYPFQVAQFLANIATGTGALSGNTTTQNKSGGFFSNRGGFKVNERPARAYGGGLDVNSMGGAVYDPGEYARGGYSEGGGSPMADILATQQAMFMGQGSPYGQKPGVGLGIPSQPAKVTPLQVKPIAQEQKGQDPLTQAANFGKGLVETKKAGQEIKSWFDKKPEGGKGPTAPADGKTADPTQGGVMADSKGNVSVHGQAVPIERPAGLAVPENVYSGPKIEGAKTSDLGGGSPVADLGGVSDMGNDQVASLGEDLGGADFGDLGSWFGNRGGAVPDYACGGVAGGHRDGYAGKGFVTPGYDPEVAGTDIMDTTVDEGEQSVNQLKGEQDAMNPKISGGGGGGSGLGDAAKVAQVAMTAASMFSDKRLKHNIQTVGKTFDGQDIYSYNLGDGPTQIGLIAQEVKQKHPEAVGLHGKYMTVDYDQATKEAADRGHFADGGGAGPVSGGLDIDRLNALLSAGSKAANTAPISYKTDDGTEFRGQTVRSGPFAEYGVGLGANLGGGRLDVDAARGSAPNSPATYRGGLKWSKNFADGGLAYREHHAGEDGNVVGEKFKPEDVAAAAEEIAPTGVDPRLVAMTPDQPFKIKPMNLEDMPEHRQNLIRDIYTRESGNRYDVRQGTGKETFDTEGPHPGIKPAPGGKSSAAGAGQFIHATWNDVTGGAPMTKGYQDSATWELAQRDYNRRTGRDLDADLQEKGVTPEIKKALAPTWAAYATGDAAPRPPTDIGRATKKEGEYAGNSDKSASIGDIVREYAPSGTPTSENFWVPALGFLGGMLTSPNRSLAGAIGSGLVSGTSGYMELRKGQQEDIKNAFANFKDQFVDAINPDTKMPAKKNKYTGEFYEPDQIQDVLAKRLRAIGADPAAYGVMERKHPAAGKTGAGTAASGPLPPPVTSGKPTEKVEASNLPGEPSKPPADLAKTDMNLQQLRASIYHDWQNSGLSEDPRARLARAKNYRDEATAYERLGTTDALTHAAKLNEAANKETDTLNKELDAAASRQDAINKESDKLTGVSANKYGDEVAARIAKYEPTREQVLALNQVYKDYMSGRSSEALANFYSWSKGLGLNMSQSDPAYFDTAMKLAMTQVVEQVQADKFQRAPASGKQIISQIVASPSADPGATYTVLGRMLGEMDYVHRRDMAYKEGTSPVKFAQEYEAKNNRPVVKDIAAGLSELEMHKNMPPDVIKSLMERYGEHGYAPKGMKDVSAPAAPTVAPGKQAGERKEFKQGWGVWNGSQWVPEGQ